jgi:filamentous hemagglutinin
MLPGAGFLFAGEPGEVLLAGSIRDVNPGFPTAGRILNCVNCSVATDALLAGNAAVALPSNGAVPISVLEEMFGGEFSSTMTEEQISQQLLSAGNGARGIVFGYRGAGNIGHVFNVVNQNGVIRFLDGQTGKPAQFGGFDSLHLLRTN